MSNQFYNYLASHIINFWETEGVRSGNKYFLRLDTPTEVQQMLEAFQKVRPDIIKPFTYDDAGVLFSSYIVEIGGVQVVLAGATKDVTVDYIGRLRNFVSDRQTGWEDKALFSVTAESLDTLSGGGANLQNRGMPLHTDSLIQRLKQDIEASPLQASERVILRDVLNDLQELDRIMSIPLNDFSEVLSILEKEKIEKEDYRGLELFEDPELNSFSDEKMIEERLRENRETFREVMDAHQHGNPEDTLEKMYTDSGVALLKKEDWYEATYPTIHKEKEKFQKTQKSKKVVVDSLELLSDRASYWLRYPGETAAKRRQHMILIFNPQQLDELTMRVKFDWTGDITSLSSEFVNVRRKDRDKVEAKVSKKFLTLHIQPSRQVEFFKIDYKHDSKATLGASFHVCVIPWKEDYLLPIQAKYEIDVAKESLRLAIDDATFRIGADQGILKQPKEITIDDSPATHAVNLEDTEYHFTLTAGAFPEGEAACVTVEYDGVTLPLVIPDDESKSVPLSGELVQERIRTEGADIRRIGDNLFSQGTYEFYGMETYRTFFDYEETWIAERMASGSLVSGRLEKQPIELSSALQKAYNAYLDYFEGRIPSLTYSDEEFCEVATSYVQAYIDEVYSFAANEPAGKRGVELARLGVIESINGFYFTAFHPLLVAYRLKRHEMLADDTIERVITKRLGAESLLPFLMRGRLYRPETVQEVPDWLQFRPIEELTVSDSQKFIANVIFDKMRQFKKHFRYFFLPSSDAPFLINVINLPDDREVLRGIIEFLLDEVKRNGLEQVKDIEVTLYTDQRVASAFDRFSELETAKDVERKLGVKLKVGDYESEDVLRAIREHLFYFKKYDEERNWSIDYAHVTFYKMYAKERTVTQQMANMPHDISLEGLYASVPSTKDGDIYRMGFGIDGYDMKDDLLLEAAVVTNELIANTTNDGNDAYMKGNATYLHVETVAEEMLQEVFDRSHWVTFIEPSVDLEFFQDFQELIIIHYSDQYTSSQKYDAITVTNKSMQYKDVIREFLEAKGVPKEENQITQAIQAFNAYNGEWLLRIIGSKGHDDREKLSIISGVKYMVALLHHPTILWVPISLEEILRVAGVLGLSKSDGVFSAKNLGVTGATSDDILMVGVEDIGDTVRLHIYPVEVKIGKVTQAIVKKAKEQVKRTKNTLVEALTSDDQGIFVKKFYQTFIVQLVIASAKKMAQGDLWGELDYALNKDVVEKLSKLQIEISHTLDSHIGEAAILLFEHGLFARSVAQEDNVYLYHFNEQDGYTGIVEPYNQVYKWLHHADNDFVREQFLKNTYCSSTLSSSDEKEDSKKESLSVRTPSHDPSKDTKGGAFTDQIKRVGEEKVSIDKTPSLPIATNSDTVHEQSERIENSGVRLQPKALEEVRLKIGTAEGTTKDVYWEYGHRELANRHLLIVGKSGQGKTYFMQALLLEQSLQGVPSVIIDYTDGFLPNQLEDTFKETLEGKINHRVVIQEKLPINPFIQHEVDYGGIFMKEGSIDVATRMKSVFASSYNLGPQQENAIYEATMEGIAKYGDQQFSIRHLGEQLRSMDNNPAAGTTLSKIRPLVDRSPFVQGETIDWKKHLESDGDVLILQLTGFERQEQVLLTEFVLWDLWNYSLREGNKNIPLTVVMDEAQNLDHRENSPSAKILTEGRKFGWSGWYATQIVKSQFDKDEVARLQNTGQKVYFLPPDDEIPGIAKNLEDDRFDRGYWERKLRSLRKGQCIVHGPHLQPDGTLSSSEPVVVNVSSLEERLDDKY